MYIIKKYGLCVKKIYMIKYNKQYIKYIYGKTIGDKMKYCLYFNEE